MWRYAEYWRLRFAYRDRKRVRWGVGVTAEDVEKFWVSVALNHDAWSFHNAKDRCA